MPFCASRQLTPENAANSPSSASDFTCSGESHRQQARIVPTMTTVAAGRIRRTRRA